MQKAASASAQQCLLRSAKVKISRRQEKEGNSEPPQNSQRDSNVSGEKDMDGDDGVNCNTLVKIHALIA